MGLLSTVRKGMHQGLHRVGIGMNGQQNTELPITVPVSGRAFFCHISLVEHIVSIACHSIG